ncbi:MAG TPA: metallophosphoesterase [Flavipsychrobacter sp.]|nr:metallophosphoesterase [Flavipsychrobacter sp.]
MLRKIIWILFFSGIFFTALFLWEPLALEDKTTGFVSLSFSGFSALFNKNDFGFKKDFYQKERLDGIDGPYIFNSRPNRIMYEVNQLNRLTNREWIPGQLINVKVPNQDADQFSLRLKDSFSAGHDIYTDAEKVIVISDIEGNFNGLYSFLVRNNVMDAYYNWIFGKGHLVLLGDFVDRGTAVTQVLWLIYSLESKASQQGGKVHYLLGNHELMNLEGKANYAMPKYIAIAQTISGSEAWDEAYRTLYSDNSELGKWLRTKNSIEKIGSYLFVHGGIHPNVIDYGMNIPLMNTLIRKSIGRNKDERTDAMNFLTGRKGILWYRGMAADYKGENKLSPMDVEKITSHFKVEKIIVGHTLNDNITKDYAGKLIKIDVLHGQEKYTGKTKGLLIEAGQEYSIDDIGNKIKI